MEETHQSTKPVVDLPTYLFGRREALLSIWRTACTSDPTLQVGYNLSQEEFNDQIPTILNLFDQQLRGEPHSADLLQTAREHGLHRWHKGYTLQELLAELNHLNQCLAAELTTYQSLYPDIDPMTLTKAYELVIVFGSKTVSGSVTQYDELQQGQAAEQAEALQQALDQINELSRQRGEFLRMTSHDLRSGLGVIQGAASLLPQMQTTEQDLSDPVRMLRRNLMTTGALLSQLTDLARLEAGQETVSIQPIDAAALLRSIVESVQPMAAERGLTLRADGPDSLPVETDSIMIQRIVQNLLLNALQHTRAGMISVSWSSEDNFRWHISVQDTGSGLPARLVNSLGKSLKPSLESASVFEKIAGVEMPDPDKVAQESSPSQAGEGIGLYVVKLLCQLLGASIDIETRPGQGTLFRIRLLIKNETTGI